MKKNNSCNKQKLLSSFAKSCWRSPIMLAIGMLVGSQAQAQNFSFTSSNTSQTLPSGTTTTSSITVDDNISAVINGAGATLRYENATADFRLGGSVASSSASLDMRSLDKFVFDNAGHQFIVGGQFSLVDPPGNASGSLTLAKENIITTSVFGIGNSSRVGTVNTHNIGMLTLGQINTINADTIQIGGYRHDGELTFGDNTDASLQLRASNGVSRVSNWLIAYGNKSNTYSGTSTVDLNHGTLNAYIDNLIIGQNSNSFLNGTTTGSLIMNKGLLDANTINIGVNFSDDIASVVNSTLTVISGMVLTHELIIGSAANDAPITGIVNLNNGATLRATTIRAGDGDNATRVINWNDGSIGNYANGENMSISGVNLSLIGTGRHSFQIDGSNASATVDAILSETAPGAAMVKDGSGTLLLNGNNTYTGATTVNDGTLVIGGSITSATTVNAATLLVNGSILSDTTVNNTGVLGGMGRVQNVNIAAGGIITNANGALTVNGDLHLTPGGIYRVQTDQENNTIAIHVKNTLTLNGAQLQVVATAGNYETARHVTILTTNASTGSTIGQFAGITSNLAFLSPTLTYNTHDVILNLARNATLFSDVAHSGNQGAIADVLNAATGNPSGDQATVLHALTALSADQASQALDTMTGTGLIALRRAAPSFSATFNKQLFARLSSVGASSYAMGNAFNTPIMLAANDHIDDLMPTMATQQYAIRENAGPAAAKSDGRGFWLRGYGNDQKTSSDGNAAATHSREVAMSVGFDTQVADGLILGAAFNHGRVNTTAAANETGNANGDAIALYASYATGPWELLGALNMSYISNSMQRRIAFGSIDRTADANFGSSAVTLIGEVSYALPMDGWILKPLAGMSTGYYKSNGFTETGADALDLQVAGATLNAFDTQLGFKALFQSAAIQWQPRAIWSHAFGNSSAPMTAQLQGFNTPFSVRGIDMPRDSMITGLTISANTGKQMSLFSDVQGEFNSRQTNWGLLFGMRVGF